MIQRIKFWYWRNFTECIEIYMEDDCGMEPGTIVRQYGSKQEGTGVLVYIGENKFKEVK